MKSAAELFADIDTSIKGLLDEADRLTPEDADWVAERASWLARAGRVREALGRIEGLTDPALRLKALAPAVDRAIRIKAADSLPTEFQPVHHAVLAAFKHHEAGNDDAAREALQPIGLQSPYLEWKVLLRGLIAYSTNDMPRALENWQRLDPARLPARLAAPLRAGLDPAFRATLPTAYADSLERRMESLVAGPLVDGLRNVRLQLGRDKTLNKAFRQAGSVLQQLKQTAPHLGPDWRTASISPSFTTASRKT